MRQDRVTGDGYASSDVFAPIRSRAKALRELVDALWGYDVFIAYRRSDARDYAEVLHQQIVAERLDCFIDTKFYTPGDSLTDETSRQVAKSTVFVLIASPAINDARELDWVEAEVDAYFATHSSDAKIVIVDIGGAFAKARPSLAAKLKPFLRIEQPLDALMEKPSGEVLDAIRKQLAGRRRDRIRIRWFQGIAAALLGLSVGLAILSFFTLQLRQNAEQRLKVAQIAESRYAAEKALAEEDPELAVQTALQGLPREDGERPFEESDWKALVEVEAKRPGLRIIRRLYEGPRSINWDPAGGRIVATDGEELAVWDASTGRQLFSVTDDSSRATWSSDGTLFAGTSGILRSSLDGSAKAEIGRNNQIIHWAPRSQRLVAVTGGKARIFRGSDGKEEVALATSAAVEDAIWNSEGTQILFITSDGIAHICDASSGTETITWKLEEPEYKAIDWSMDGKIVATAFDKKVILWDANDGKKRTQVSTEYTRSIGFAPDGSWLMIAGYNGVSLNDTRDGHQLNSISVHAEDAALSPDGRLIAVASNGGVFEWDFGRGRKRWLRLNELAYKTVAWSPDSLHLASSADYSLVIKNKDQRTAPEIDLFTATTGWEIAPYTAAAVPDADRDKKPAQRVIVSLSRDGRSLDLYDLVTKRRFKSLSRDATKIQNWFWKPDGTRLAVMFVDGAINLWSAVDQSEIPMAATHKEVTQSWWGEGWFMTQAKDNSVKIWAVDTGKEMISYQRANDSHSDAFWKLGAGTILVKTDSGEIAIWDIPTGKKISTLSSEGVTIEKVLWSPDGRQLVLVSPEALATLWNVETGTAVFSWGIAKQNLGVSWSPGGDRIVTISDDQAGVLRNARTGEELAQFKSCWSVDWSVDSRRVLMGCEHQGIYIDASNGKTLVKLEAKEGVLGWEAAWDPSGTKVLATCSSDRFYILERDTGALLRTVSIPEPWIIRGVWDGKGERVTVFSGDRIVSAFGIARVFDAVSGQEMAVLRGHEKNILGGRWDPSGTNLLTWSQDTTARIWDVRASRELAMLSGHSDFVLSGEWSGDGAKVTTKYAAPPVYTWNVAHFELSPSDRIDWMRASLGIPELRDSVEDDPSPQQSSESDAATLCQMGAENPVDPARRRPGVQIEEIKPFDVAPACEKAMLENPASGRLNYLYGRTRLRIHDKQKAYAAFEKAASQGYAIASIDLGAMMLDQADAEHYAPMRGIELLEKAAKALPIANVALAGYFETTDRERATAYLDKAKTAGESHAYQVLAEQAERRAQAIADGTADEQWLEAFRNWSIAYNLSRYAQKRGPADWEFPLARRAALAWHLAERGGTTEVVKAYRSAAALRR